MSPVCQLAERLVNIVQLKNDDIFTWNIGLIVLNPDSLYYGGYFKATMTFPSNYPYSPPSTSAHFLSLCRVNPPKM